MRLSLMLCGILFAVVAAGNGAEAQNYPWCAQYVGRGGGAMNCGFVSFDQCMQTARGAGAFCIVNNRYQPPIGPAHPVHKNSSRKLS